MPTTRINEENILNHYIRNGNYELIYNNFWVFSEIIKKSSEAETLGLQIILKWKKYC